MFGILYPFYNYAHNFIPVYELFNRMWIKFVFLRKPYNYLAKCRKCRYG